MVQRVLTEALVPRGETAALELRVALERRLEVPESVPLAAWAAALEQLAARPAALPEQQAPQELQALAPRGLWMPERRSSSTEPMGD